MGASPALRKRLRARVGPEAAIPVAAVVIVLLASVASWLPASRASGAVGGPAADGPEPRLAVGGIAGNVPAAPDVAEPATSLAEPDGAAPAAAATDPEMAGIDQDAIPLGRARAQQEPEITGAFQADGTLLKPIAVTTAVADGRGLLKTYEVRRGDSLTGIANRFGVSMMTIAWANNLKSRNVPPGKVLTIPPVNGLVVTAKEGDTLESIGQAHKVAANVIYETNGLEDQVLVVGQTLVLPGAVGAAFPRATVAKAAKAPVRPHPRGLPR